MSLESQQYQGTGGAPGIVIGKTYYYIAAMPVTAVSNESADAALARFGAAQHAAVHYLCELEQKLRTEGRNEEADILSTQALFAEDVAITDEVVRRVREDHEPLEAAFTATIKQVATSFEKIEDDYLRERAADIEAVGKIIHAMLGGTHFSAADLPPGTIIVAPDLTPAETAVLRDGTVAGFATAYGGPTGHTAILARSLGIPAVVGLGSGILELKNDAEVILDGDNYRLIACPTRDEKTHYMQRIDEQRADRQRRRGLRDQSGQLADGHPVSLWANIGHPDEARLALEHGAAGVGLFRTEFLFLNRSAPPDEEEQYHAYCSTLEYMRGHTVVVRTLDIGGDKDIPYLHMPPEANPFLGVRGLRLCMQYPDLLRTQLRALLRAAVHGDLWIMLPMIATPADLEWGRVQVDTVAAELAAEEATFCANVSLGVMIETPAAAVTADLLAQKAAFLSVGSNDLTQYAMASDRGNAHLAAQYAHDTSAVLRLIAQASTAARQAGIPIGVCGELAGVPDAAVLLAGLGITELSMAPVAIPAVKERLLAFTLAEARTQARRAMKMQL